jgi:hypothetical protein
MKSIHYLSIRNIQSPPARHLRLYRISTGWRLSLRKDRFNSRSAFQKHLEWKPLHREANMESLRIKFVSNEPLNIDQDFSSSTCKMNAEWRYVNPSISTSFRPTPFDRDRLNLIRNVYKKLYKLCSLGKVLGVPKLREGVSNLHLASFNKADNQNALHIRVKKLNYMKFSGKFILTQGIGCSVRTKWT